MKFKDNFKRFFTLDRHHDAGFTLVELIVVIAILAILAGISIPAYTGYIGKANLAADQQVMSMVNNCFAAAAADAHKSVTQLAGSTLKVDSTGLITGLIPYDNAAAAAYGMRSGTPSVDIGENFMKYLGNNVRFKTIKENRKSGRDGFAIPGTTVTVTYNGTKVEVSQAVIDEMQSSQFGSMGAGKVLGEVDFASTMAQVLLENPESTLHNVLTKEALGEMLGYDLSDAEQKEKWEYEFDQMVGTMVEQSNGTMEFEDAYNKVLANSAVLSVAQNAQGMTTQNVTDLLTSNDLISNLSNKMDSEATAPQAMAEAALAYGMYTAYMHKNDPNYEATNIGDLAGLQNAIKDEAFQKYVESDEGQADLQAYINALGVVRDGAQGDVATNVLMNGYGDNQELQGIMESILGKK